MHKYIIVAMLSLAFYPQWPAHALAKGQEIVTQAKTAMNGSAFVQSE